MHIEPARRWTAKRKIAILLAISKGETTIAAVMAEHDLSFDELREWAERFTADGHLFVTKKEAP